MKALVKFAKGSDGLEIREIAKPTPKRDELLVKVMAVGVCGTDVHIMNDEYACNMPVVIGHEYTGIVEQVGADIKRFSVGDQIVSDTTGYTCESCKYCKQGLRMLCPDMRSIGSGADGAMAEYLVVPAKTAYKVPENMRGSDILAIAEPVACVVRAVVEQSKIKAGDIVLVSGPGTIGLITLQLVKLSGAFVIISGTKSDAQRLELAKEFGADVVCDDPQSLGDVVEKYAPDGVDVAFECAGARPSLNACLEHVKTQGNLAQVGLYGKPITVDFDKILFKELNLTVSFASEYSSWEILMNILAQGSLKLEPLVSEVIKLEDWRIAFDKFVNRQGLKIFLKP